MNLWLLQCLAGRVCKRFLTAADIKLRFEDSLHSKQLVDPLGVEVILRNNTNKKKHYFHRDRVLSTPQSSACVFGNTLTHPHSEIQSSVLVMKKNHLLLQSQLHICGEENQREEPAWLWPSCPGLIIKQL